MAAPAPNGCAGRIGGRQLPVRCAARPARPDLRGPTVRLMRRRRSPVPSVPSRRRPPACARLIFETASHQKENQYCAIGNPPGSSGFSMLSSEGRCTGFAHSRLDLTARGTQGNHSLTTSEAPVIRGLEGRRKGRRHATTLGQTGRIVEAGRLLFQL